MYCPLKLYFLYNLDEEKIEDYQVNKIIKDLRIDIFDLLQRNMRKLKKEMKIEEIEKILSNQIEEYVKNTFESIENLNEIKKDKKEIKNITELKNEIKEENYFNIKIMSLKSEKAMKTLEKDGNQIVEFFFPNCVYNYFMKDNSLNILGTADKIEIIQGHYYPILFKKSFPPLKGVWDGDIIEIIATAILIEQEFNTEVNIGFVDYLKINERRTVILNQETRKTFFRILTEINDIIENGSIPNVKTNLNKCKNCEYQDLCENT